MNIKPAALSRTELIAGFAVKVLLGLIYGYVYLHYYTGDDTWKLFRASLAETDLLRNNPALFFRNEYTPLHSIEIGHGWKEITTLYMNDLQYALFVKSMAFINLVSGGNYYINVVVFNMIVFFGHYWFFIMMNELFPEKRKWLFIAIFFFLPAVFWLSGLRIDGLLFFFLSLFLLHLVSSRKKQGLRFLLMAVGFAGVFLCRPEFAMFLSIAVLAYIIAVKMRNRIKPVFVFAGVYSVAVILFFMSAWIIPDGGMPGMVARIQHKFIILKGTRYATDELQPTITGFIKALPGAALNTFFRPLPWEAKGALQLMASAEMIIFWMLAVFVFMRREPDWKLRLQHPVILLLICLAVSVFVSLGYIVPFPGAIIRYKAIAELMLIGVLAVLLQNRVSSYKFYK
jgi:hypothetical protein